MRLSGPVAPIMKRHPLTGAVIEPVGVVNGKVVWPICGGAIDGDEDDDDNDGKDDADSGSDGKGKVGKDDDGDSGAGKIDADEAERLRKRMQAADRRAEEAERKIREIADKDKDELTKAKDRATELEATVEEKDKTIRNLQLQVAFLSANKHAWHDPDTALDLADRNGYLEDVVDDDGKVDRKALGKALDRLATEKAFLVKTEEKKNDDGPGGPSGEPAGGRSDNSKDERAKKDQLKKRFPVLNR